jgi:outer membrane lipoprotein LolB
MRRLLAVLVLGLAAGCATTRAPVPAETMAPWPADWTLQGRIGVQSDEQSLSGNIRWQHHAGRDEVLMTSPLGQGVARIVRGADGVLLEVPNRPPRWAADAESLTHEALGYALPVSGLVWWVRGLPDPARAFEARHDAAGRLDQLRQDGWVIDYLQYAADARPRKLVVAREGLAIRLVADSWQAE